jgi:hypothetical protein
MQLFLVAQEGREVQQVAALDVLKVDLAARLREVGQRRRIRCVGLGLFRELRFLEKIGDSHGNRSAAVLRRGHSDTVIDGVQFRLFLHSARACVRGILA